MIHILDCFINPLEQIEIVVDRFDCKVANLLNIRFVIVTLFIRYFCMLPCRPDYLITREGYRALVAGLLVANRTC